VQEFLVQGLGSDSKIKVVLTKDSEVTSNFEIIYRGEVLYSKKTSGEWPPEAPTLTKVLDTISPAPSQTEGEMYRKPVTEWQCPPNAPFIHRFPKNVREEITSRAFVHAEGLRRHLAIYGLSGQEQEEILKQSAPK